jgi:hypothetical protein
MKTLLLFLLLALPLQAEIRGAVRGGVFQGTEIHPVGTIELDARHGNWAFAPAVDWIQGTSELRAVHINIRRLFQSARHTFWIGAGQTFVNSANPASVRTWDVDAGLEWRNNSAWEPFVAGRHYSFRMPIFRDVIKRNGAVISIGISRRFH